MDETRARVLVSAERERVQLMLAELKLEATELERWADEHGDAGEGAEHLTADATQEEVARTLRARLEALGRAQRRLEAGAFGHSIRSGRPIPDDRLVADPAAELLTDEITGEP